MDWYDLQTMIANFGASLGAAAPAAKVNAMAEPELLTASVADTPDADVLAIAASVFGNRLAAGHHDVPLMAARPANLLPRLHIAGRVGASSISTSSASHLLSHDRADQVAADVLTLARPWWADDSAARELPDEPLMTSLGTWLAGKPRKGRLDPLGRKGWLDPLGMDILAAR